MSTHLVSQKTYCIKKNEWFGLRNELSINEKINFYIIFSNPIELDQDVEEIYGEYIGTSIFSKNFWSKISDIQIEMHTWCICSIFRKLKILCDIITPCTESYSFSLMKQQNLEQRWRTLDTRQNIFGLSWITKCLFRNLSKFRFISLESNFHYFPTNGRIWNISALLYSQPI